MTLVGLTDTSVRESRDRVQSAIRNSGFDFPQRRVTVNLSPADLRKGGSAFDLPITIGVLAGSGRIPCRQIDHTLVLGELSLDGTVRAVRGVLPLATEARRAGISRMCVPMANADEAAIVPGLDVEPVATLGEAVVSLSGTQTSEPHAPVWEPTLDDTVAPELADVRGQSLACRALEIAAAGGHNLLFVGPPGAGKSMLSQRFPGILPPLTREQALEVTTIHSVAGLLPAGAGLFTTPPFRATHHTASNVALTGGRALPRPGEISLAHHGVLLLDEATEFGRHVLDCMRQPLEERVVRVSRAARTTTFPARFLLAATVNPCMCGYLGNPRRRCGCTPQQVDRYRSRLSGPLRDRIDLSVWVPAVSFRTLRASPPGEGSIDVRRRVVAARDRQSVRHQGGCVNARLQRRAITQHCELDAAGFNLLDAVNRQFQLSARSCHRVMKVASTMANLAGVERIAADHVAEAVQLRMECPIAARHRANFTAIAPVDRPATRARRTAPRCGCSEAVSARSSVNVSRDTPHASRLL